MVTDSAPHSYVGVLRSGELPPYFLSCSVTTAANWPRSSSAERWAPSPAGGSGDARRARSPTPPPRRRLTAALANLRGGLDRYALNQRRLADARVAAHGLSCRFGELWAWAVTVIAPTVTSHHPGNSIEVCKGACEHHFGVSPGRYVSRGCRVVRTTHKTVKRVVERAEAGGPPPRSLRPRNFDAVTELVAAWVAKSGGRISAKRLLPIARAAGYEGSARNTRRLVAEQKSVVAQRECPRAPSGSVVTR